MFQKATDQFFKVDKNIEATEALVDVLHKEKTKKTSKPILKCCITLFQ